MRRLMQKSTWRMGNVKRRADSSIEDENFPPE